MGALKKTFTCVGGGEWEGLDLMNVSRILAPGGPFCRVLRGSEAFGRGSEMGSYEDLMNVSRVLALGGSICHVLRGSEALWGRSY